MFSFPNRVKRFSERASKPYADHRKTLINWLFVFGKNPETADEYAHATVKNTAQRLDIFYRWVWDEYDGYTTDISHAYVDAYMKALARKDKGNYTRNNVQSAIKRLFK